MRKSIILVVLIVMVGVTAYGQNDTLPKNDNKKIDQIFLGMRVNPSVTWLDGEVESDLGLYVENGYLFGNFYTAIGWGPAGNTIYSFNEYWFNSFESRIPIALVVIGNWNYSTEKYGASVGIDIGMNGGKYFTMLTVGLEKNFPITLGVVIPLDLKLLK